MNDMYGEPNWHEVEAWGPNDAVREYAEAHDSEFPECAYYSKHEENCFEVKDKGGEITVVMMQAELRADYDTRRARAADVEAHKELLS